MSEQPFRLDGTRKPKSAAQPSHGFARLTLHINQSEYALWKVPVAAGSAATACYELKKRGSSDRYHVSQHDYGCECTCGDWTFRRNHIDVLGCKHIKSLAAFGLVDNHPAPARER